MYQHKDDDSRLQCPDDNVGGVKVKSADETIIKFRNGKELHKPPEMYEEIGTKGKGIVECSWTEGEYDFKVQFSLEDVLHITRITRNTSNKCN